MALGRKTGGRKPGSVNRFKRLREQSNVSGLPIEKGVIFAEMVLDGKVPCGVCHGKRKTKFQPRGEGQAAGERTCQSCWGSGLERLSPSERLRAALDLIEYGYAKKKAIDVTNSDGTLRPSWEVVILEGKDGKSSGN